MPAFPHLDFIQLVTGSHSPLRNAFPRKSKRSEDNLANLRKHGKDLSHQIQSVQAQWKDFILRQAESGFELSTEAQEAIPIFLQVDPNTFKADTLRAWGIDVVAEEANGFIIGVSSSSSFPQLSQRLSKMMLGTIKGVQNVAELWEIQPRGQSLHQVVAEALLDRWATLDTESECWIEVSVSIDRTNPGAYPPLNAAEADLTRWDAAWAKWDAEKDRRTAPLDRIIDAYRGYIHSVYDQSDTCNYKISIPGKGVKDIALNFPYALEINEWNWQSEEKAKEDVLFEEYNVEVVAPNASAARVCVIDSGIQTSHRLLTAAIEPTGSRCYVPGETSVADHVSNGGHGTRVASAVLYPEQVPTAGIVKPIAWLQNARVLNASNSMDRRLFPPFLMRRIVDDYRLTGTRLYNLSIQSPGPCRTLHMSSWAAEIDQLSFDQDVLFITSAGNIHADSSHSIRLSVAQHLSAGRNYPEYLQEDSCRIGNPAQSCQALTVGSVAYDRINTGTHSSFGGKDSPSAFSRTGLGMWGMIKPEVVEYGGDYVQTAVKTFVYNIPEACPELVTSTIGGHPAVSRSDVGTSYASPKVAHIAAALQNELPQYSTLLYRALIVQSAQWPAHLENGAPDKKLFTLRTIGYGIPDIRRALDNSDSRVTFIKEDKLSAGTAHLYQVKLAGLNGLDDDTLYRIDVTLSYAARPRRTRQTLRNYVSTRLQWHDADLGQSLNGFVEDVNLTLQENYVESTTDSGSGTNRIYWQIGTRSDSSNSAQKVRRQGSTLQKDWAFVRGYELSRDRLLFAVTAHKGWDDSGEEVPYALAVSVTSLAGVPIYENIRIANEIEINTNSGF